MTVTREFVEMFRVNEMKCEEFIVNTVNIKSTNRRANDKNTEKKSREYFSSINDWHNYNKNKSSWKENDNSGKRLHVL